MKVSVIGAGNVGATLAKRIIEGDLADCVLLDVAGGLAEGKALDLLHAAPIIGYQRDILGTDDYKDTKDSDIVVITAGFARQPGMSRADLMARNSGVIKDVAGKINKNSPGAIIIVVTNPLDAMTYLAYRESGFDRKRVMGMAGLLDSSRFAYIIAKGLGVPYKDVETIVIGRHSPQMIPLISQTKVSGKLIAELISKEEIDRLITQLRESGSKIVSLLGKGSAFYAPSAACFSMIKAIKNDEKGLLSISCIADGEYGIKDVSIGLPARLGKDGIEEIVDLKLEPDEIDSLKKSANNIKELAARL